MEVFGDEAVGPEPGQGQTCAEDISHWPVRWG